MKAQEQFAKRAKLKHDLGTASDRVEREVTRFRMKVRVVAQSLQPLRLIYGTGV